MTERCTVLVVGAGPVGLSVALTLARADVEVRIIDSGDDIDRHMRASTFHPPTLDDIDSLGLGDQLVSEGLVCPRFQLRQHETGRSVAFDLTELADVTKHPYRLQIEQHRYCELAVDALADLGVDVEFSRSADTIQQKDACVRVTTSAAPIECDWLVGCDGGKSRIRKELGQPFEGKTYMHSSVLVSTTFPFHDALPSLDNVSYCWSVHGPFTLLRLRSLWRVSLYPGVTDTGTAAAESRVRARLAQIHPDAGGADLADISPYRVHARCVKQFRSGRVLLAGDAAHLNPPSGGMGMNGGIHDAMNLGDKLLRVIGGQPDALLDRYDRQRRTLVNQHINTQAVANRERMATHNRTEQLQRLAHYRAIANCERRRREHLLRVSMIAGLEEEQRIE